MESTAAAARQRRRRRAGVAGLLLTVLAPLAIVAPTPPSAYAGAWCSRPSDCRTWSQPFYAHGIIPVPAWKRCVIWEFRARLSYRVAEEVTGAGGQSHMVEGLWLSRTKMRMRVHRYCDPEHNDAKRSLGGVHVQPSIHMTGSGSGSCSLTPSVGVSFPWSISVGVSPSCDEAKIARREQSMVSSRTAADYRFGEAEPAEKQLSYSRYTTMLDPEDYRFTEYHAVCFRVGVTGSVEHPKRARVKSYGKSQVRCLNLLDGSP
jgi:hypothetical protein